MSVACKCDISLSDVFQNDMFPLDSFFQFYTVSCSGDDSCEDDDDSSDGSEPQDPKVQNFLNLKRKYHI